MEASWKGASMCMCYYVLTSRWMHVATGCNYRKAITFTGFSVGCCINEEKVICCQLELGI